MTLETLKSLPHDDWASPATCLKMSAAMKIVTDNSRSLRERKEAIKIFADITGTNILRLEKEYLI